MQPRIAILFFASAAIATAAPPRQDRDAILSMAGSFNVSFNFEETFAVAPGYASASKPYHENAMEVVAVAEDTPERITLQHVLVVGKDSAKPRIIKHWAQVWTWQDGRILDYAGSDGDDAWLRHVVPAEKTEGKWSELVTSIDDTPRYESLGRWIHADGESSWHGEETRRPMPRREYEVRDDYDYLQGTNTYTLTPTGWVHSQDNRKVVDRDGKKHVLAHETGINLYTKTDGVLATAAGDWWKENAAVWNPIRNFWIDAGERSGPRFAYHFKLGGISLKRLFSKMEKTKPAPETVAVAIEPYLAADQ